MTRHHSYGIRFFLCRQNLFKPLKFSAILAFFLITQLAGKTQAWKLYSDSADALKNQKNFNDAISYYIKAKKLLEPDSVTTDAYTKLCTNLGDVYFTLNDYDSSEIYYLQTKNIAEKIHKNDKAITGTYDKLGRLYAIKGEYSKAANFFLQSKEIKEIIFTKESPEYAAACTYLGNVYTTIGEYDKAEKNYTAALAIRKKFIATDSAGYAQVCNNLSNLYRETGEYEKAEPLAQEAKTIRGILVLGKDSLSMINAYAISCTNIGNLYRDMGEYSNAETLYLEAKKIRERIIPIKGNAVYASSCNILADLYYFMAKYKEAEALYLEAKQIREQLFTKDSYDYAQSCNNLASLYRETGEYIKAETLAAEGNKIWTGMLRPNDPAIATSFENLGLIALQTKNYSKALEYFFTARNIWQQAVGTQHSSFAATSFELAKTYWASGNITKANTYYTEAFNIQQNQVKKVFRFTSEREKELYLKNIRGPVDEFESFYFSNYNQKNAVEAYNIALLSKNLTLSATQALKQAIFNMHDTLLYKKYEEWETLKKQIGMLYIKNDTSENKKLITLQGKANDIEKQLVAKSNSFKTLLQTDITWKDIQQSLQKNEAAIQFVSFNFYDKTKFTDSIYYMALLLRKDNPAPILIKLFEQKQLDNVLASLDDDKEIYLNNYTVYKLLWKPIKPYLDNVSTIYFSPSGDLFKISLAALPVNEKEVLSDRYRLIQLNNTSFVINNRPDFINASDNIQLYGGIDYSTGISESKEIVADNKTASSAFNTSLKESIQYLPGTKTEIELIENLVTKKQIPVKIFSGAQATEESFKALNGNFSPAVIHIATHGFFFSDPVFTDSIQRRFETNAKVFKQAVDPLFRSGLLFAGANYAWQGNPVNGIEDGIVTAYDVSNMYLPNTKLVVLSACETALGDIKGSEGVYGLQRAFKIAGVKNLVMSLWKVPDDETSEFMQLFYKNMFKGRSVSDAFYFAQSTIKNKYRNEPYKWAAWILIK